MRGDARGREAVKAVCRLCVHGRVQAVCAWPCAGCVCMAVCRLCARPCAGVCGRTVSERPCPQPGRAGPGREQVPDQLAQPVAGGRFEAAARGPSECC